MPIPELDRVYASAQLAAIKYDMVHLTAKPGARLKAKKDFYKLVLHYLDIQDHITDQIHESEDKDDISLIVPLRELESIERLLQKIFRQIHTDPTLIVESQLTSIQNALESIVPGAILYLGRDEE